MYHFCFFDFVKLWANCNHFWSNYLTQVLSCDPLDFQVSSPDSPNWSTPLIQLTAINLSCQPDKLIIILNGQPQMLHNLMYTQNDYGCSLKKYALLRSLQNLKQNTCSANGSSKGVGCLSLPTKMYQVNRRALAIEYSIQGCCQLGKPNCCLWHHVCKLHSGLWNLHQCM